MIITRTKIQTVAANPNPAGADKQIQFNDAGGWGIDPDITWDKVTNSLGLKGINPGLVLQTGADPAPQDIGLMRVYAKYVAGKPRLKIMDEHGLDIPLQNALYHGHTVLFSPAAAAGVWLGTSGSNLGSASIGLPVITNPGTMLRRSNFASVVTTLNQQVGTRTENIFTRGNSDRVGGFFFAARFVLNKWTSGNRLFVGMASATTTVVTVNPSGLTHIAGFGVDDADSAITFMHNDAAGTATKIPIPGQPALITGQAYVAYVFCKPNDNTLYFRLDDINAGVTLIDSSVSGDLPVNNLLLNAQCIMGNGANTVVGDASIGVNKVYIETDN